MITLRRLLIVLLIALSTLPVYARGSGEKADTSETPPEPAVSEPAPEPEPEAAMAEEAPPAEEEGPTQVAMDDATAQVLFSMGMSPFQNRIPSEDFILDLLDGGKMQLQETTGSFVFLNFWATWCPPCRAEMPSMQVLYDELAAEGLEVLAVNVLEDEATVAAFIEENQYTYPVLMDLQGRVSMRYAVRAYPTTYLIDRQSRVIGVRSGYHEWDTPEMIEAFRTLMAE